MDELLREFHMDNKLHQMALDHAKEKGMKLGDLNVWKQSQAWDIVTDAIDNGMYHTSISEEKYIDKLNGKRMTYAQAKAREFKDVRKLSVLPLYDRVIWNAMYKILYNKFCGYIHPLCLSYKQKVGTPKIAWMLSKKLKSLDKYTVIKGDLEKFFDRVPIEIIDECIEWMRSQGNSKLYDVITECYHDNRLLVNGEMTEHYGALKQGNPMGCLFADLILADIDEEMTKYDVTYYRYCDDFIIIGKSIECHKAFDKFVEMLNAKGIKLNDSKTEVKTNRDWVKFLGFRFRGGDVSISKKTLDNIKHKIKMETITQCRNKKRALTEGEIRRAIDNIQYYLFVGCEKKKCGMATYMYQAGVMPEDIDEIDKYAKECIMAAYTNSCEIWAPGISNGKYGICKHHNKGRDVRMNRAKAQHIPKKCGWYSLNYMRKKYLEGKEVYQMEINQMRNGTVVD